MILHFCTCFSSLVFEKATHVSMKNTIVEQAGCPLMLTNAPQRLSCTHTHSESNILGRWPHDTQRQSSAGGGAQNDPSVGMVGVHIRQVKWQRRLRQMNQPSRCERSVKEMFTFIHPSSSAASVPPGCPLTWRLTHSPTHIETCTAIRDTYPVAHACTLRGCLTHHERKGVGNILLTFS